MVEYRFGNTQRTLPKYLTDEEVLAILERVKKIKKRDYLMMLLLWKTGLRVSEMQKLKKKDIREDTITVWQGKGMKDRVIPLEKNLGDILGVHMDYIKSNDRIFTVSVRQIRNIVYKYSPFTYKEINNGYPGMHSAY